MLARYKQKRETALRMRTLKQGIDAAYEAELHGANTPAEREIAYEVVHAQVKYEENELEHLRQADLLTKIGKRALAVPMDLYDDYRSPMKITLTYAGEIWARKELKRLRREEIKFWAKLVMPALALLLSAIALILAKTH